MYGTVFFLLLAKARWHTPLCFRILRHFTWFLGIIARCATFQVPSPRNIIKNFAFLIFEIVVPGLTKSLSYVCTYWINIVFSLHLLKDRDNSITLLNLHLFPYILWPLTLFQKNKLVWQRKLIFGNGLSNHQPFLVHHPHIN